MDSRLKRRLIVVTGIIIIVVVAVLAIVGNSTSHRSVTIAQAVDGSHNGERVQVTGKVVENSYSFKDDILTFEIYDDTADTAAKLKVVYDRPVSSTFGNEVIAICTGRIDEQGVLQCTDLVTKCPSKYESSTDALSIEQLIAYGNDIVGVPVKVSGVVKDGSLKPAGQGDRFILTDMAGSLQLPVEFDAALSEKIQDGSVVVLTGSLDASSKFVATEVALKG